MSEPTELEKTCGYDGTEPDTVIIRVVPRAESLECGRDALGEPLKVGDVLVCLCCGATWDARVLTEDEIKWGEGFDFPGSVWVKAKPWLIEAAKNNWGKRPAVVTSEEIMGTPTEGT